MAPVCTLHLSPRATWQVQLRECLPQGVRLQLVFEVRREPVGVPLVHGASHRRGEAMKPGLLVAPGCYILKVSAVASAARERVYIYILYINMCNFLGIGGTFAVRFFISAAASGTALAGWRSPPRPPPARPRAELQTPTTWLAWATRV